MRQVETRHNLFMSPNLRLQMYEDAVQAIHDYLIQKSLQTELTYTAELIPERDRQGEMWVQVLWSSLLNNRAMMHI